jgi:hypothetical protein
MNRLILKLTNKLTNKSLNKLIRRAACIILSCALILSMPFAALALKNDAQRMKHSIVSDTIDLTSQYLIKTISNPTISPVGGEWVILGLARSEAEIPENYYERYYENVVSELKSKDGNLTRVKFSEYSRLILALTAIGRDVTDVGGYNLLEKLADYNSIIKQGINGPIFALLALDCNNYEIPQLQGITIQTTRELLIDYILNKEITDANGIRGGFSLSDKAPDADITGMALQALAKYKNKPEVRVVIDRGLSTLDRMQSEDGSFNAYGTENSESIVQAIVAKSALGIDCADNVAALMRYLNADGSMRHTILGEADLMATEQGLYAFASYERYIKNSNSLYDMTDVSAVNDSIKVTLNGRHLKFEQPPVNIEGRVLVPMRAIFEAIGAEITWDGKLRKVTGVRGQSTVELTIGKNKANINGKAVGLDVPAQIINNRTMAPVRFVSESLDAKVDWVQNSQTVVIVMKDAI